MNLRTLLKPFPFNKALLNLKEAVVDISRVGQDQDVSLQRSAENNDSQLLMMLSARNTSSGHFMHRHMASLDESALDFSKDFAKLASNM